MTGAPEAVSKTKILAREDILGATDLVCEMVSVPEWGGCVIVKTLTAQGRDEFEQAVFGADQDKSIRMRNIRARTLSLCLVDDQGQRLFTEADIVALGEKSAKAMDRAFSVCQRLNALTEADIEELLKK